MREKYKKSHYFYFQISEFFEKNEKLCDFNKSEENIFLYDS